MANLRETFERSFFMEFTSPPEYLEGFLTRGRSVFMSVILISNPWIYFLVSIMM